MRIRFDSVDETAFYERRDELTALGHSLLEPIVAIGDWAEIHVDRITTAQAAYDAAHQP